MEAVLQQAPLLLLTVFGSAVTAASPSMIRVHTLLRPPLTSVVERLVRAVVLQRIAPAQFIAVK